MTTVIADRVAMEIAGDSRITDESTGLFFRSKKVFLLSSGEAVGISGSIPDAMKFLEWYESGCDGENHPDFTSEKFDALVLDKNGSLFSWDSHLVPSRIEDEFFAIGSGALAAMGAMHMGATATQAVLVAAKLDRNTDEKVVCVRPNKKSGDLEDF